MAWIQYNPHIEPVSEGLECVASMTLRTWLCGQSISGDASWEDEDLEMHGGRKEESRGLSTKEADLIRQHRRVLLSG